MRSLIYFQCFCILLIIETCTSQELQITKIQRYDIDSLYLCFGKEENVELTDVNYYQLVIIDTTADVVIETPVINQETSVDENTKCITFGNSELQDYAGKQETYFILTGRSADHEEVVFGTAQLNVPTFPENEDDSVTGCFVGTEEEMSLRINDHTKPESDDWSITFDGATTTLKCLYPTDGVKDSAKVPCYVIRGLDDVGNNPLTMCLEVPNQLIAEEKVTVCGKEFTPKLLPPKGPELEEAILDYSAVELKLVATLQNGATEMDIVLYTDSDQKIYVKQTSTPSLNLIDYTAEFKKYNLLSVGVNSAVVKESDLTYFQDFKINAQVLAPGSGIMEVQWKKTVDVDKFSLSITSVRQGIKAPFTETTVNCPGVGGTFCYGYFVELTSGDNYDVTFKPYAGATENSKNSILLQSFPISSRSNNEGTDLSMKEINITWNVQNEAVVRLCFHCTDDFKLAENNHEAIVVNNEGQWQREKRFIQPEQGILCSVGITLPSAHFIRNSVLTGAIVKRNENGFDVIQSGYSTFELS